MSDISNSNSSSSKRHLSQIDDAIEYLTQEVNTLNDFVHKTEFECSLMTVKIKREKVKALSAFAKSQALLANMTVLAAESDLLTDVERLRNFKRTKLDRNEGKSQVSAPPNTTTVSVQTTESMYQETRPSSSRKSPVDISSDKPIHESSVSSSTLVSISLQLVSL